MLENKRSREITDSALIMISKAYDPRCEIVASFSSVLGFVDVGNETSEPGSECLGSLRLWDAASSRRSPKSRSGSRSIHRMATGLEVAARKKLRKEAVKPMKSLACVNLCGRGLAKEP